MSGDASIRSSYREVAGSPGTLGRLVAARCGRSSCCRSSPSAACCRRPFCGSAGEGFAPPLDRLQRRAPLPDRRATARARHVTPRAIVLEPEGRNTAPAATIAALLLVAGRPRRHHGAAAVGPRRRRRRPLPCGVRTAVDAAADGALGHLRHSGRPGRRPATATSARAGRWREPSTAAGTSTGSSRSPTRPPPRPTSRPATTRGTAACSCCRYVPAVRGRTACRRRCSRAASEAIRRSQAAISTSCGSPERRSSPRRRFPSTTR